MSQHSAAVPFAGTPVGEYQKSGKTSIFGYVAGIVMLIVGVPLALVGLLSGQLGAMILLGGLGLFVAALAVWVIVQNVRNRDLRVLVFADGLSYIHNGKTQMIPWENIETFSQQATQHYYNGAYNGTSHELTLGLVDGSAIKLTNQLQNVEALGQTIQASVFEHQLARAVARYQGGETVRFGPLSVTQSGISGQRGTVPWDQIKSIAVANGCVSVITPQGAQSLLSQPTTPTPNLPVLVALCNQIIGSKQG